jgi:hypothetical protein
MLDATTAGAFARGWAAKECRELCFRATRPEDVWGSAVYRDHSQCHKSRLLEGFCSTRHIATDSTMDASGPHVRTLTRKNRNVSIWRRVAETADAEIRPKVHVGVEGVRTA